MTSWLLPIVALGLAAAAPAQVIDGDTLTVEGHKVRLWGIDAPEGRQLCQDAGGASYRCGEKARGRLKALIGGRPVACVQRDEDAYGRAVAQCSVSGVDLGETLVRSGWAVEYRQFSRGAYGQAEAAAKAEKRGLWAGAFEPPEAWRASRRAAVSPPAPPPGACVLKGNINAKGRRIVHAPGQRDYASTAIDAAKGERWFCTSKEAQAAGWTPAQR